MSYFVKWHPKVRKFLRKLPKKTSSRIVLKMEDVAKDPFRYLEHYEGEDYYKLRIGNYRALIDIEFSKKLLLVRKLDLRSRIYKQ